jgi:hypothetical protein
MEACVAPQLHRPLGDDGRASLATIWVGRVHDTSAVLPQRACEDFSRAGVKGADLRNELRVHESHEAVQQGSRMVAHQRPAGIERKVGAYLRVFGRRRDISDVGNVAVRCGDRRKRPHIDAVIRGQVVCRFTLQKFPDDVHVTIGSGADQGGGSAGVGRLPAMPKS